jgi:hypothetical protein
MLFTREDLINRLRNGVVSVTFEKVDGTVRVMSCTLQSQYLPEEYRNKAPMLTEETGNSIAVWDLGVNQWRSFRVGSVRDVK